jgi:thioredoxin-like negative regulator of GroEL
MATLQLDLANFHKTLAKNEIVVIQCWATWCGGCSTFEAVFETASFEHSDVTFGKVDTGRQPQLTKTLGVSQVPSLLVFREGVLLLRLPGAVDGPELNSILAQARALDMDVVRNELEREARKAELAVSM